jgi:hypothetical protein
MLILSDFLFPRRPTKRPPVNTWLYPILVESGLAPDTPLSVRLQAPAATPLLVPPPAAARPLRARAASSRLPATSDATLSTSGINTGPLRGESSLLPSAEARGDTVKPPLAEACSNPAKLLAEADKSTSDPFGSTPTEMSSPLTRAEAHRNTGKLQMRTEPCEDVSPLLGTASALVSTPAEASSSRIPLESHENATPSQTILALAPADTDTIVGLLREILKLLTEQRENTPPADRSLSVTHSGREQPMGTEHQVVTPTSANQDMAPVEELARMADIWVLGVLYLLPPVCVVSLISSFPNHKLPVFSTSLIAFCGFSRVVVRTSFIQQRMEISSIMMMHAICFCGLIMYAIVVYGSGSLFGMYQLVNSPTLWSLTLVIDYAAKALSVALIWPVTIFFLRFVDTRRWGGGGNGHPWTDPILYHMVPARRTGTGETQTLLSTVSAYYSLVRNLPLFDITY